MQDMIADYIADIKAKGAALPRGYEHDPAPMQICKLSDALNKAQG